MGKYCYLKALLHIALMSATSAQGDFFKVQALRDTKVNMFFNKARLKKDFSQLKQEQIILEKDRMAYCVDSDSCKPEQLRLIRKDRSKTIVSNESMKLYYKTQALDEMMESRSAEYVVELLFADWSRDIAKGDYVYISLPDDDFLLTQFYEVNPEFWNHFRYPSPEEWHAPFNGINLLGEVIDFPDSPDPNNNEDLARYDRELKAIEPRIKEINDCADAFSDVAKEFYHFNKVLSTNDTVSIKKHIEELNKERLVFSGRFSQFLSENLSADIADFNQKLIVFDEQVSRILSASEKLSIVEVKAGFLLDKHQSFLDGYMISQLSKLESGLCIAPPLKIRDALKKLKNDRDQSSLIVGKLYRDLNDSRSERIRVLADGIRGIRSQIHLAYAESQGESLDQLSLKLKSTLELFRLGEDIYKWSDRMRRSRYANRLDTRYLHYSAALKVLRENRQTAEEYIKILNSYPQAPELIVVRYEQVVEKRLRAINNLIQKVEAEGWQGFLNDQIYMTQKRLEISHVYPERCEDRFKEFISEASKVKDKKEFMAFEGDYSQLLRVCYEVAK